MTRVMRGFSGGRLVEANRRRRRDDGTILDFRRQNQTIGPQPGIRPGAKKLAANRTLRPAWPSKGRAWFRNFVSRGAGWAGEVWYFHGSNLQFFWLPALSWINVAPEGFKLARAAHNLCARLDVRHDRW